jgi:hypothetical protein
MTEDSAARSVRATSAKDVVDRLALAGDSPCPSPGEYGDVVYVASEQDGVGIDPCGGGAPLSPSESLATGLTIDFMTTSLGYSRSHVAGGSIDLFGSAVAYTLSDGSGWASGAGTHTTKRSNLARVEVTGDTVRYFLYP